MQAEGEPEFIDHVEWSEERVAHVRANGVEPLEVHEALDDVLEAYWDRTKTRRYGGPRLVVLGRSGVGREILIWLHPVNRERGAWRLGTAKPLSQWG